MKTSAVLSGAMKRSRSASIVVAAKLNAGLVSSRVPTRPVTTNSYRASGVKPEGAETDRTDATAAAIKRLVFIEIPIWLRCVEVIDD